MATSTVTNDNMGFSKVKLGSKTCLVPRSIGKRTCTVLPVEDLLAYIAFRADFHFCRIYLILGGLTCVDMKSIVV